MYELSIRNVEKAVRKGQNTFLLFLNDECWTIGRAAKKPPVLPLQRNTGGFAATCLIHLFKTELGL